MEDNLKKKMEDDLNFKAVLLRLFNNKNLKTNGFDTIEIDLVSYFSDKSSKNGSEIIVRWW